MSPFVILFSLNAARPSSWNGCGGSQGTAAQAVLTNLRELVDVPFFYEARSRHHIWVALQNCTDYINPLNYALGLLLAPPPSSPPPYSGAIIEMTGHAPKIIFGTAASPVCELLLDRTNNRLESTCPLQTGRRLEESIEIASDSRVTALEQKNKALTAQIADVEKQLAQVKMHVSELLSKVELSLDKFS